MTLVAGAAGLLVPSLVPEAFFSMTSNVLMTCSEKDLKIAKQKGRSVSKSSYIVNEEKYLNGDTTKQLLTRSIYLLYKPEEEYEEQKIRAAILFEKFSDINKLYYSIQRFRKWY